MISTAIYLTFSAFSMISKRIHKNMITVKGIGYQFHNPFGIDINRTNGSGDFLFLYFRTPAEVMLRTEFITLPEGTFLLYKKNAPQIYKKSDGSFINDWMHFDIEPYDNFFENLGIPFNTPISFLNNKIITDMIADLFIEFFNEGNQHEFIMDTKMRILFHKFSDMYKALINGGASYGKYFNELSEIRQQIHNYQYRPAGADEVAMKLNISTSYFQHIYKKLFGVSIHQDIIKGRIEHAGRLLQGTDASVSEISLQCGYENLEHFSRQFKKIKGVSPNKYRK